MRTLCPLSLSLICRSSTTSRNFFPNIMELRSHWSGSKTLGRDCLQQSPDCTLCEPIYIPSRSDWEHPSHDIEAMFFFQSHVCMVGKVCLPDASHGNHRDHLESTTTSIIGRTMKAEVGTVLSSFQRTDESPLVHDLLALAIQITSCWELPSKNGVVA